MSRRSRCFLALVVTLLIVCFPFAELFAQQRVAHPVVSAQDFDRLVGDKDYRALESHLPTANLNPVDRLYFEGILADRLNRPSQAISKLQQVLPRFRKTNRHRAAIALFALAADYFMTGRYAESATAYSSLLADYGNEFSPAERQGIEDNRNTIALLDHPPAQSVSGEQAFQVTVRQNRIGTLDIPLQVSGKAEWWMFDTGANISTITQSTAKRLGLSVSKGHARTQSGATGSEVALSVAVISRVTFGRAEIRNVATLVMDDTALQINVGDEKPYQIDGILGYPVLAALGSFSVRGNEMVVRGKEVASSRSARLYVEQLTPLLAAKVNGEDLVFQFDTGNAGAELTAKFKERFPQEFATLKSEQAQFGGAGGARMLPVYHLPQLDLYLGTASTVLHNVTVVGQERGVEPVDSLYGNFGQALLKQFSSYTIDFTDMRLTVGEVSKSSGRNGFEAVPSNKNPCTGCEGSLDLR